MPRCFATPISAAATARICGTPPAAPSMASVEIVCTESTTSRPGRDVVEVREQGAEVVLGGEEQLGIDGADALGPQPHLRRRFLAGDDQRAAAAGGIAVGHVEQQRRLADAGLAGEQHDRPGYEAAAEHPVEFGDAGRPGAGLVGRELTDRPRGPGDGRRRDGATGARADLGDRAPGLALGAATDPAQRVGPALGAAVGGLCGARRFGHDRHRRCRLRQVGGATPRRSCAGRRRRRRVCPFGASW